MSKYIEDMLRLAREGGDFYKYIEGNDIPILDFARFIEKVEADKMFGHHTTEKTFTWTREYFRGEKGDNVLRNFLQNGIENKEDYYVLSNIINAHPSHNRITDLSMNHKDDYEKYLSPRDKLYMEVTKKLREAREKYSDYPSKKYAAARGEIDDIRRKVSDRSNSKVPQ